MKAGWPAAVPEDALSRLSARDMEEWWKKTCEAYSPQRANHLLMFVRRAVKLAREQGALIADPTSELKPVKIPRTRLELPTREQFFAVVESMRQQTVRNSESADFVEFMAYSGMRPGEIQHLLWEHIGEDVIAVYGGKEGTKNREPRKVPIIPAMADLLARMRAGNTCVGRVFWITKPRDALRNACKRLGLAHQRIYNLRHLFATTCLEAGVDVPTFAMWLGHKDGGALAMKTYVQNRTEHSARMAAKVTFGR